MMLDKSDIFVQMQILNTHDKFDNELSKMLIPRNNFCFLTYVILPIKTIINDIS